MAETQKTVSKTHPTFQRLHVCLLTIVVEIDAMTSVGLDVGLEGAGIRESLLNSGRNAGSSAASCQTVATAVDCV